MQRKIILKNPKKSNTALFLKSEFLKLGTQVIFVIKHTQENNRFNIKFEPRHEISNNVVCATIKVSDQSAHMPSLIRAFASCLKFL